MLTKVILENFQSHGERREIPLAPITLIYGKNSAGKSSIIRALKLLHQSGERPAKIHDSQSIFRWILVPFQRNMKHIGFPALTAPATTVRLAFAEFTDLWQMKSDFASKVAKQSNINVEEILGQ